MDYFTRIINQVIRSILRLGPLLPLFPLVPSILFIVLQTQKNHISYVLRDTNLPQYDYVIIGAGSAGSVMAARLSEDPTKNILLLEAGLPENVMSDCPRTAFFLQKTPMDWKFQTQPQKKSCWGLKGQRMPWPRGKVMGGSSTINFMAYIRGNNRDYDQWGVTGWTWADIFPYFAKAEDVRGSSLTGLGYYGKGGPLTITRESTSKDASQAFVHSSQYMGYPTGDPNGPLHSLFSFPMRTIKDGERFSVSKAYLEPIAHTRDNLHIMITSFVTKIIFDGNKRAVGVEFFKKGKKRVVRAMKEVILSAGALMSPKVLMLSGIGHSSHLKSFGIKVIADLPVGDNLQEHVSTPLSFTLNESISMNFIQEVSPDSVLEYWAKKKNPLSSTLLEAMSFMKTKYENQSDDYPDIQMHFLPASIASDYGLRIKVVQGLTEQMWKLFKPYSGLNSMTILPTLLRPMSRGWVRLQSANPFIDPAIDPQFFSDEKDLDVLLEGIKLALAISQSPQFQRYNATPFQVVYPGCEPYPLFSDDFLKCMAQTFTTVIYHPMGTCKMGAIDDPTAVVDPNLRVKGVTGLRVVDASIIPFHLSGNTNAPVVAIAEKAADHIKGQRILPFVPPMSQSMIDKLPEMPFELIENF